jgi:membrane protein involved in colicin uptake
MGPKAKALEKAALNEAEKDRKAALEREKAEAAAWSVGAKDSSKASAAAAAEAEKMRKAAEKAALMAEEEAMLGGVAKVKAPAKKKDKNDDFAMLNAALSNAPKTKAQKEAEEKKKAAEAQKKKEEEARLAKEARLKAQEAEMKEAAKRGIVLNHTDELFLHQKSDNRLDEEDDVSATGLENALDALGVGGGGGGGKDGGGSSKALWDAYFERELPSLKEMAPGLKLSQYRERLWANWGKSAENPRNQAKMGSTLFDGPPPADDATADAAAT